MNLISQGTVAVALVLCAALSGCANSPPAAAPEQPRQERLPSVWYKVKVGDNLELIASEFTKNKNNAEKIAAFNSIQNPADLKVGEIIYIPKDLLVKSEEIIRPLIEPAAAAVLPPSKPISATVASVTANESGTPNPTEVEYDALSVSAGNLWGETSPGMNSSQVFEVVEGSRRIQDGGTLASGAKELIRVDSFRVVNESFQARFYFISDKLTQVTLGLDEEKSFTPTMRVFDSIADALSARYGKETSRNIDQGIFLNKAEASWQTGKTKIGLIALAVGESPATMNVNFQTRLSAEAGKLPLVATPEEPTEKLGSGDETCDLIGDASKSIMTARQSGMSARQVIGMLTKGDDARVDSMFRQLVLLAYDRPRYSTSRAQTREIEDFENDVFVKRLSDRT